MGAEWTTAENAPKSAVWKYRLDVADVQELDLPQGAEILRVAVQGGDICLWALVLAERDSPKGMAKIPTEKRRILMAGTGHKYHPNTFGKYLGTIDYDYGTVFHIFETP